MPEHRLSRELPYDPPALFDLVADCERYPEFLPGYIDARIQRRTPHAMRVEQTVGVLGLRFTYRSLAVLRRPRRLTVRTHSMPFQWLRAHWHFDPTSEGCQVTIIVRYILYARWLEGMVNPLIGHLSGRMVNAFVARAHKLHGARIYDVDPGAR